MPRSPKPKGAKLPRPRRGRGGGEGALASAVIRGDQAAAARALTAVVDEREGSEDLLRELHRFSGTAHKVGFCGPPGCGKSTLVGRLVGELRKRGERLAVLAVDPSSPFSGGAFLGDRLRIQEHALDPEVFIRSLASRGMVGGLTHSIFGAVRVMEAYGARRVLLETVGTGQDEVDIARVADTVLYVTTPTLGDEIQAMKAGAMEVADVFVVNKSDLDGADRAVADLSRALGLGEDRGGWRPRVLSTSALTGRGAVELADVIEEHRRHLEDSGERRKRLKAQLREELTLYVSRKLYRDALRRISDEDLEALLDKREDPVTMGRRLAAAGAGPEGKR